MEKINQETEEEKVGKSDAVEAKGIRLPGISLTCPGGQKMSVNLYKHIVCVLGWGKTDCCFKQKEFFKSVERLSIQCKSFTKNKTAFRKFLFLL